MRPRTSAIIPGVIPGRKEAETMPGIDAFMNENEAQLEEVMAAIEASRDALIARLREIAEIPSPTFEESRRTEYLTRAFPGAGLKDVHSLKGGSVLAYTRGKDMPVDLLLAAHIDTVFPMDTDIRTHIDGGLLRGPGTGDNAANVAAILTLAEVFNETGVGPAGNVVFCGTVREEGLGNLGGMAEVLDELGDRTAMAIAVDGMSPAITYRSQAIRRYAVTLRGPGGHSWNHFGAPSAIHEMARIVSGLASLEVPEEPRTTFNVGKIQGGRSINAIAQQCSIEVDLRSLDEGTVADLEKRFLDIVAKTPREGVSAETELIGTRPGAVIDAEHDLVKTAEAAARHTGLEPVLNAASTDAALPLSRGIPAISFGTYTGSGTHSLDEYVEVDSLTAGLRWLAITVLALTGLDR
jgi:acetylornithine deacetylase/succinyl-diaminopimelate desuccinylase-like protein